MPTIARRLFIPDYPSGTAGQVLGIQSDGTAGWIASGTNGTPEPYTNVDTLSATPRSVTDWGPLINTAISGGARRLLFGAYQYPFSTPITSSDLGVIFEGDRAGGMLLWTGTGSGYAIDLSNAGGQVIRDIDVSYNNAGYTGTLINASTSFYYRFENVSFGHPSASGTNAKAAFTLANSNTILFNGCTFQTNSFASAVRGIETGSDYSNVIRFKDCTFYDRAATNPSEDWLFEGCVFEFYSMRTVAFIAWDINMGDLSTDLTVRDCDYWDATGATQKLLDAGTVSPLILDFRAYNCTDHSAGGLLRLYDLQCRGYATVVGGLIQNPIDFGNASNSNLRKERIVVAGTSGGPLTNVNTGHTDVCVLSAGPNAAGNDGLIQLQHEIGSAITGTPPTIAAHPGATNINSVDIRGNDLAGYIVINNTSGSPSSTGLVADITLAAPPTAPLAHREGYTLVQLTPISVTAGDAYGDQGAHAAACNAYAFFNVASPAVFSLGITVALPAGTIATWAYRITHI